jgi:hypothetical protein
MLFRCDVAYHQSCQCKSEDGCDVCYGAVGLCLAESGGLDGLVSIVAEVGQQFVAIDALELARGTASKVLEALAQGASQRTALNLPELRHTNACGVHLQCRAHGGE